MRNDPCVTSAPRPPSPTSPSPSRAEFAREALGAKPQTWFRFASTTTNTDTGAAVVDVKDSGKYSIWSIRLAHYLAWTRPLPTTAPACESNSPPTSPSPASLPFFSILMSSRSPQPFTATISFHCFPPDAVRVLHCFLCSQLLCSKSRTLNNRERTGAQLTMRSTERGNVHSKDGERRRKIEREIDDGAFLEN